MVRVAELDRLLDVVVLPGVVARKMEQADDAAESQEKRDDRQNAEPGIDVGVAVKSWLIVPRWRPLSEP